MRLGFGVDVGGTGIKAACVDLDTAQIVGARHRVATPPGATPADVATAIEGVLDECGCLRASRVGVAVPAVVRRDGVVTTAANIDHSWIGTDAVTLLSERLGRPTVVLNDADAVGLVEGRVGAAAGHPGTVVVVTLGTGIGTAVLVDGKLMPNTELGHLVVDGRNACFWACSAARERESLSWKEWAGRLNAYLHYLEDLTWPDLIVLGGGISKKADKFVPLLDVRTDIVAATRLNDAGIVGAALACADAVPDVPVCPAVESCRVMVGAGR